MELKRRRNLFVRHLIVAIVYIANVVIVRLRGRRCALTREPGKNRRGSDGHVSDWTVGDSFVSVGPIGHDRICREEAKSASTSDGWYSSSSYSWLGRGGATGLRSVDDRRRFDEENVLSVFRSVHVFSMFRPIHILSVLRSIHIHVLSVLRSICRWNAIVLVIAVHHHRLDEIGHYVEIIAGWGSVG